MPNQFQYHLQRDPGATGNFEVTIFKNADLSDAGTAIYSKKASGMFPFATDDEWNKFLEAAAVAVK